MNWQLLHFKHLDSTQSWLKNNYQELDEGVCVLADQQAAGQGRAGRHWHSEPGGLYFSFLLKPLHFQSDLPWLIWAAALSVLETLLSAECTLKAPNDILYQGQKVAGSLIDAAIQGQSPRYYICGLGLNLNQADFPESLAAVSLSQILGQQLDRDRVLQTFLTAFESYYACTEQERELKLRAALGKRQIQIGYNKPEYVDFEEYWNASRK